MPSEAEWEYAAAGGSQQLDYPWGSTDPGSTNQYAIYNHQYTGNATDIAPVGFASQGVARWGQLDLAGEVFQWNLDWYASYTACSDCTNATATSTRGVRGGDFAHPSLYLLPTFRGNDAPTARGTNYGIRCARTP